mgnify:CR=1 FL=1
MQYHVGGELVDAADAALPVDDRAVAFGDAVTDTIRCYGGTPFAWERHVDRLFDACAALGFDPGVDAVDLRARVEETLAVNELEAALIRVSITRGPGGGGQTTLPDAARHRPPPDPDPTVVVTAAPVPDDQGSIRLQTVRTRALSTESVPAAPLTHARLDAVCAQAELRRAAPPDGDPADEAVLLDTDGHVVGGTASDPVFVDGEAIRLPALGDRPARTATRAVVRQLADSEGLPVAAVPCTPADLRAAEEAFVAEPSAGIRPVASLDGVAVGGGPVTDLLSRLFADRVAATCR